MTQSAFENQAVDEKIVAFVPVRLSSSRLAHKHLRIIGDRPLLAWVLSRIKSVSDISNIVVCAPSTTDPDDLLRSVCTQEGVELFFYVGDENDVVGRLAAASEQYSADICVMVSGDCPLAAPDTLKGMIDTLRARPGAGWVEIASPSNRRVIHEGLLVARAQVWRIADRLSNTPELRAHQFPVLAQRRDAFEACPPVVFRDFDDYDVESHRISVDTPADLEFMRSAHEALRFRREQFDLRSVLKLLQSRPSLKLVNRHVYQRAMNEYFPLVLFVVSAVKPYGHGNLMRSLEVADELVESYSVPSQFVVLDDAAACLCDQRGYTARRAQWQDVSKIASELKAAMIVFDINSNVQISESEIVLLRQSGAAVVFIDNTCPASHRADAVVIPTAHHCSSTQPNLVAGADYVVIKKDVRRLKNSIEKQPKLAVVYRGRATVERTRAAIVDLETNVPGVRVLHVDHYRTDFARLIAAAQYVVSPLSQTSYEAAFLGAQPCLIHTDGDEQAAALFIQAVPLIRASDGRGANRIAMFLNQLAQGERGGTRLTKNISENHNVEENELESEHA